MRFSRDRRGQSVVVGTVILFGFLILALGIYQVQVVPTENADVEFEHSQEVEDRFGDLRNGVLEAASTGTTRSAQIPLGTRYPSRTFFVNPPPVSGSLTTQEAGEIRVRNATIGGDLHRNVGLYWDTNQAFETRSLRYAADYNEFRGAPRLTYEHSVVAAEFDDAILLRSGQTVLSEDGEISLTALTGTVSENGVTRRSVDARAVSASDTTVPIAPDNGSITLELPTAVDDPATLATRWEERLPPGAIAAADEANGTVRITLANGSYRLGLSEVSLDTTGTTEPAYIVPVGSQSVGLGGQARVEVRDRYHNPVPDATVSFKGANRTTGDDGRAFFEPTATGSLTAAINENEQEYESVSFDITEGDSTTANQTFDIEWDETAPVEIEEGTSEPLDILVSDAASGDRIDGAAVDVGFSPRGTVSGLPSVPDPTETDSDGRTTVDEFETNDASAGDSFNLYATAGDDADRIVVDIIASTTAYEVISVDPEPAGSGNSIDVSFDINTDDENAQVNVQSLDNNGDPKGETGLIAYDSPQPQTIKGANQAVEVRVILYDGDGVEQDRLTVPYP
ncbi:hypothetical protein FK85_25750 [Halorubrum saccharovorum]|uniref:Big-1 domain-containing protein n=1 Tax=Halorubrum saccharovorum TaxID=2248 RepID=A0A0F8CLN3_9EURY|nr:hypothetical protein [Halorubrum saccharovorum]KKF39807.1 hypothetical protein FK85_25750 [Halorubrum saccharovorum]